MRPIATGSPTGNVFAIRYTQAVASVASPLAFADLETQPSNIKYYVESSAQFMTSRPWLTPQLRPGPYGGFYNSQDLATETDLEKFGTLQFASNSASSAAVIILEFECHIQLKDLCDTAVSLERIRRLRDDLGVLPRAIPAPPVSSSGSVGGGSFRGSQGRLSGR